jgi:hypothetical protein
MRRLFVTSIVLAALSSCAGLTPAPTTMSAARAGLRSEYRLFYDSLVDHGDWLLIEPHGYVFRPDVNFVAWRPYSDGYWAPSNLYGWVWISAEPFGWATYHYGRWFYDRFHGWAWAPGRDWAPAWVEWSAAGGDIGWAPRILSGTSAADIPGGAFVYAPMTRLGSTDIGVVARPESQVRLSATPERIENPDVVGGVRFERGPSFERVERVTGPLPRVQVADLVPAFADTVAVPPPPASGPAPAHPLADATERAGREAARSARQWLQVPTHVPARVEIVRPVGGRLAPRETPAPRREIARPDTTRR